MTARRAPMLFDAFPALARDVPWMALADVPTPIERCAVLCESFGHERIWTKRDDLISPVYGGNKIRRFEFIMADVKARNSPRIVTVGGLASTQVTATSLFGQALSIPVRAVLFDQPLTAFARQAVLTDACAGAELIYGGGYARTIARTWRAWSREKGNYFLAPGASDARSNLGYLDAMLELDAQVSRGECPRPDVMIVPAGTSGTLAALALGAAWLGWDTEVVGVRITALAACNPLTVRWLLRNTARFVARRDPRFDPARLRPRVRLFHGAIGPGYGEPTPEAVENIALMRRVTGHDGEVTYSGKALVGLRAIAQDPRYRDKNILLWHTLSSVRPGLPSDAIARVPSSLRWIFDAPTCA